MGRRSRKKIREDGDFMYVIKDKYFPDFHVRYTDTGWWADKERLLRLIDAFKLDCLIKEAVAMAGITYEQYNYFVDDHPEFNDIKQACQQLPISKARTTVMKNIGKDVKVAMEYIKQRDGRFQSRTSNEHTGKDGRDLGETLADMFLSAEKVNETGKHQPKSE